MSASACRLEQGCLVGCCGPSRHAASCKCLGCLRCAAHGSAVLGAPLDKLPCVLEMKIRTLSSWLAGVPQRCSPTGLRILQDPSLCVSVRACDWQKRSDGEHLPGLPGSLSSVFSGTKIRPGHSDAQAPITPPPSDPHTPPHTTQHTHHTRLRPPHPSPHPTPTPPHPPAPRRWHSGSTGGTLSASSCGYTTGDPALSVLASATSAATLPSDFTCVGCARKQRRTLGSAAAALPLQAHRAGRAVFL